MSGEGRKAKAAPEAEAALGQEQQAAARRRRQPRRITIVEADFLIEPFTHLLLIGPREVVPAVSAKHAEQLVAAIRAAR